MTTKADNNRKMHAPEPQRGNGSELMRLLSCYITYAFDNERDFLRHFKLVKEGENGEMIEAAKPVIDEALKEVEKVMKKKLATMVIATLDSYYEMERMGNTIRIIVKHDQ